MASGAFSFYTLNLAKPTWQMSHRATAQPDSPPASPRSFLPLCWWPNFSSHTHRPGRDKCFLIYHNWNAPNDLFPAISIFLLLSCYLSRASPYKLCIFQALCLWPFTSWTCSLWKHRGDSSNIHPRLSAHPPQVYCSAGARCSAAQGGNRTLL